MKWKCTFRPEEEEVVGKDLGTLLHHHPKAKTRQKRGRGTERVIYLEDKTIKN